MNRGHLNRISLAVVLVALPALALTASAKDFQKTVNLDSGGRLRLETYKGSINLTPWEKNQVEIVARIEPGEDVSQEYGRESVEATKIEVWGGGSSVSIKSDYDDVPCKEGWRIFGGCSKTLPFVHYTIRAPRSLRLVVDDYKSEVRLGDFEGRFELETYKGTMETGRLAGEVRLETYKGKATLADVSGELDVETYKGEVRVRAAQIDGDSRLETYKGKIEVGLAESQRLTVRGDIGRRADFNSDVNMVVRTFDRDRLEGEINGGGPRLYVKSYKGDVRLRRQ